MSSQSDPRVVAALHAASKQIDAVVADTEASVERILGLVELLMENADTETYLRLEGIMEACSFQDLTGQRLNKVKRLVNHLNDKATITMPESAGIQKSQASAAYKDVQPAAGSQGLSQEEVDRLLKG